MRLSPVVLGAAFVAGSLGLPTIAGRAQLARQCRRRNSVLARRAGIRDDRDRFSEGQAGQEPDLVRVAGERRARRDMGRSRRCGPSGSRGLLSLERSCARRNRILLHRLVQFAGQSAVDNQHSQRLESEMGSGRRMAFRPCRRRRRSLPTTNISTSALRSRRPGTPSSRLLPMDAKTGEPSGSAHRAQMPLQHTMGSST